MIHMVGIGASILGYVVGHHGKRGPMAGMVAVQGAVADQHTLTRMAGGIRKTGKSMLGRTAGQEVSGANVLMMRRRVMLGEIISPVGLARPPKYVELALAFVIA